jgi:Uma2 family endonuclease
MGLPARLLNDYTVEEYLAFEKTSPIRHEYVDGHIYAMTGASKNHARITKNIAYGVETHLRDSACEPYTTEVKVKARATRYYYPDVVVTCEAAAEDPEDPYLIVQPILIVEVLSPTTKRTDKVEKMNAYQQIPGLLEYVIVAQDQMRVEIYRHRKAGDVWQGEVFTEPTEQITCESIGLSLSLADIYRRVTFPAQPEGEEAL